MDSRNSVLFAVLFLSFSSLSLFGQGDYRVLSSSNGSVTIEYTPQINDSLYVQAANTRFRAISVGQGDISRLKAGALQTPARFFQLGVTDAGKCQIQVISSDFREVSGVLPPVPTPRKVNGSSVFESIPGNEYAVSRYYPSELSSVSSKGNLRGLPIAEVQVNPVQCNPVERKIRLLKRAVLQVTFPAGANTSALVQDDELVRNAVINYSIAKRFVKSEFSGLKKTNVVSSVLATGKWVRFETPDEGIYKITGSMLSSMGFDLATLDPAKVKIYNNGGKVLSESVTRARVNDLQEVAIYVSTAASGTFSANDYILFYGRNFNFWEYNTSSRQFMRYSNPYATANYYWITADGAQGKRIQSTPTLNSSSATLVESTLAFSYLDQDKVNIGKSGREFLGDQFLQTAKTRSYSNTLEGLLAGTTVDYKVRFVNADSPSVRLDVRDGDYLLGSRYLSGYGTNQYSYGVADVSYYSYPLHPAGTSNTLQFTYNATDASSTGYLDYYEISYTRDMKAVPNYLIFFSPQQNGVAEYHLSDFVSSSIQVFDVTDYANPKLQERLGEPSGGEFRFQANVGLLSVSKYLAVNPAAYKTPINFVQMSNQNLHGESQGAPYVIITPKEFYDEAKRLATFRMSGSKVPMNTIVVKTDEIYNEFSGGVKDVSAVRDYLRYGFQNWTTKPMYVMLFGHGDYDFRNIEGYSNNYIFPYETQESLDQIYSYNSDDYFARVDYDDMVIDLAVGRMPARTVAEAKTCVDKIIAYETSSDRSAWRNLVTLVADDGWHSKDWEGTVHTENSEYLSKALPSSFDQKKIYLAAYPTAITSFGRTKPGVNEAIIRAINEGTLLLNYVGHGSPELWADEHVFVKDVTIPQLKNKNLFFLTAATCDFCYFDRPNITCSAEELVFEENYGAVGCFASTRPGYSQPNIDLAIALYQNLLQSHRDTLNLCFPVGLLYFQAKTNKSDINDLKFHLLCDPALRLNLPQLGATVDSINKQPATAAIQIKALSHVNVKGTVLAPNSTAANTGFTGEGLLTIFDSEQLMPLPEFGSDYTMVVQGGVIFKGKISVTNGSFNADFTVPKDISYENRNGKMVLYFYNQGADGIAFSKNIIVGGTDSSAVNDNVGPEIKVAFDDPERTDAYLIKPNSTLYVLLSDASGINATGSGVGRVMHGILDGDEANPIDFTNYYSGDLNTGGKSGKVTYKFDNLAAGEHSLKIDAWDVFNNTSSKVVYVKVNNSDGLVVDNIYNYPNPFSGGTVFMADHNDPQPVSVKIRVYSVTGRLLHEITRLNVSERSIRIPWDGRDIDGNMLANGVYLYKVTITSASGFGSKSTTGKLAIIR